MLKKWVQECTHFFYGYLVMPCCTAMYGVIQYITSNTHLNTSLNFGFCWEVIGCIFIFRIDIHFSWGLAAMNDNKFSIMIP
jgi:hypothetical protein